ncbi:GlsB/YeaQ/YmgE family stress response membrane protein [Advenella sp. RU8]|uniref:GlsB/YeaQ/YmgE family stress response membrane protein n=1 Tax=Advenella sp. RU8 TaxID=3399575 RepID=UPI003AB0A821
MDIIWEIIIGFLVGLVARALMPGSQSLGLIMTTLLGVVGSLVATNLGLAVGIYEAGSSARFIGSVVGALIVLFVYGLIAKNK